MKYINGVPEGTGQNRTDKAKQPRRLNHKEQWYIQQMKLDPSLKEEHAKHMEFRNWEKEMHNPGEIEHKRELVETLRGGKVREKQTSKREAQKKIVVREPTESILKALIVDEVTGHQKTLWITANIIYQDIPNGVYWVYNELSQCVVSAILGGASKMHYRKHDFFCKELKRTQGVALEKFVVDLKKAVRSTTRK